MAWNEILDEDFLSTRTAHVDSNKAADINQVGNISLLPGKMRDCINALKGGDTSDPPTDDLEGHETRIAALESYTVGFKENHTRINNGEWYDIYWKDADEIVIKCKSAGGYSWIGVVLSDDSYIEATSDITIKYDTPGNSGHILDGITAKLNSAFQILWFYEDSGNALAAGFTWMPGGASDCTFSNANPTNTLTLNQVNAQDIGYLFPASSHVCVFQDTDEWETPVAWQNAVGITYDPTKDKPKLSSRTSTVLTLGANLENNDFTASSKVYQVDNFKPLAVDDGLIVDVIGSRGYRDSGLRLPTDAGGNLIAFAIYDGWFYYINGSGAADSYGYSIVANVPAAYTNYKLTSIPPDKKLIKILSTHVAGGTSLVYKIYYMAYGQSTYYAAEVYDVIQIYIDHGILSVKDANNNADLYAVGYKI